MDETVVIDGLVDHANWLGIVSANRLVHTIIAASGIAAVAVSQLKSEQTYADT